jgi:hypothetical protein
VGGNNDNYALSAGALFILSSASGTWLSYKRICLEGSIKKTILF